MRLILNLLSILSVIFLFAVPAHADLIDIGGGMLYDDVLNITWTQNANLPGSLDLTWVDANSWAANLTLNGLAGWRLPYASVIAGVGPIATEVVNCAAATELQCRDNELGYMFYYNLGGLKGQDMRGNQTTVGGEVILGVQDNYWTATEAQPFIPSHHAWSFGFNGGGEGVGDMVDPFTAWAVHDGKAASVPESSSILLLSLGITGLITIRFMRDRAVSL